MTITTVVADLAVDVPHELEDLGARVGVELAGRLVREEHLRLVRQRDRHGHALLLAAAEAIRADDRARSPSPTSAEQLARPVPARAAVAPVEDHRQLDVLRSRQVGQQVARGLLPHEADDAAPVQRPLPAAHRRQVVAGDDGAAGRRDVEAAQDGQEGRLAGARGADDGDHLARIDEQVKALERDDLEIGDLVDLDEVVARDLGTLAEQRPARRARREGRAGLHRGAAGQVDDVAAHLVILADSLDSLPRRARQARPTTDPGRQRDPDRQHADERQQEQSDDSPVDHQHDLDR